jgi:chaperonin GroES
MSENVVVLSVVGVTVLIVIVRWFLLREVPSKSDSVISKGPRGDRVLVRRSQRPAPESGQVAMPDSQQKPLNCGTVVAVGPGLINRQTGERVSLDLEPGDIVEFCDFAQTVDVEGEEMLLLRDEEIWRIV